MSLEPGGHDAAADKLRAGLESTAGELARHTPTVRSEAAAFPYELVDAIGRLAYLWREFGTLFLPKAKANEATAQDWARWAWNFQEMSAICETAQAYVQPVILDPPEDPATEEGDDDADAGTSRE